MFDRLREGLVAVRDWWQEPVARRAAAAIARKGRGYGESSLDDGGDYSNKDREEIGQDYAIWFPGGPTPRGMLRQHGPKHWLKMFRRNASVSACVKKVTDAILSDGHRLAPVEDGAEISQRTQDLWAAFVDNVHPALSFDEVLRACIEPLVLGHHFYVEVSYDKAGLPVRLWPDLPQHTIWPLPNPDGTYGDQAFVMIDRRRRDSDWKAVYFSWQEILWLRLEGMHDGSPNPLSPIDLLTIPTETTTNAQLLINSYFRSGGKVGMVVRNDKWMEDEAASYRKYLEQHYSDAEQGHKILVLYDGTEFIPPPTGHNNLVQYIDIQKYDHGKVCNVMDVDPRLVGADATGALGDQGAREQAHHELLTQNANPKRKAISRAITKQILQEGFGIFDAVWELPQHVSDIDAGIRKTLAELYASASTSGIIDLGYLPDLNGARAEVFPYLPPLTEAKHEDLKEEPEPDAEEEEEEEKSEAEEDVEAKEEEQDPDEEEESRSAVASRLDLAEIESRSVAHENAMAAALHDPLMESVRAGFAKLAAMFDARDTDGIAKANLLPGSGKVKAEFIKRLKERFSQAREHGSAELFRIAKAAGHRGASETRVDAPAKHGDLEEYVDLFGTEYWDPLYEHIVTTERDLMVKALKDGLTRVDLLTQLEERLPAVASAVLSTAIRTSGTDVANLGRQQAAEDSEIVAGYEFVAITDDRITDVCDAAGNPPLQIAINRPEVESLRPPLNYNCRSVLSPILVGEPVETDEAQLQRVLALIPEGFR